MAIQIGKYKRPGIFIEEFDNSVISSPIVEGITNTIIGVSKKGPVNTPILLKTIGELENIFGPLDRQLERKGSFFHRTISKMLESSPVFAINLLLTDDALDRIEYQSLSAQTTAQNDIERLAPYRRFFDTTGFWKRDTESFINITKADLDYEKRVLNFTNLSDKYVTIFVFKSKKVGFDRPLLEWYGGIEKLPPYVNPTDLASDYLVDVVVVAGDYSDYRSLSVDPRFSNYFSPTGLRKNQVIAFTNDRNITTLAYADGLSLIPYFRDLNGQNIFIETVINRGTDQHGVFCSFNADLFETDYPTGLVDLIGNNMVGDDLTANPPTSGPTNYEELDSNDGSGDGEVKIKFLSYEETITDSNSFLQTVLDRPGNVMALFGTQSKPIAPGDHSYWNSIDMANQLGGIKEGYVNSKERTYWFSEGYVNDIYRSVATASGMTISVTYDLAIPASNNGYAVIGGQLVDIKDTASDPNAVTGLNGVIQLSTSYYSTLTTATAKSFYAAFAVDASGNIKSYQTTSPSTKPLVSATDIVFGYASFSHYFGSFVTSSVTFHNVTIGTANAGGDDAFLPLIGGPGGDFQYTIVGSASMKVEFIDTNQSISPRDYERYRRIKNFNYLLDYLNGSASDKGVLLFDPLKTLDGFSQKLSLALIDIKNIKDVNTLNRSFEIHGVIPTTNPSNNVVVQDDYVDNYFVSSNDISSLADYNIPLVVYKFDNEFILGPNGLETKSTIAGTYGVAARYSNFYQKYEQGIINTTDVTYQKTNYSPLQVYWISGESVTASMAGFDYLVFGVDETEEDYFGNVRTQIINRNKGYFNEVGNNFGYQFLLSGSLNSGVFKVSADNGFNDSVNLALAAAGGFNFLTGFNLLTLTSEQRADALDILSGGSYGFTSSATYSYYGFEVEQNVKDEFLSKLENLFSYNSSLADAPIYLDMYLDNELNLKVNFEDRTLSSTVPFDSIDGTTPGDQLWANNTTWIKSLDSNYKQSVELEFPSGYTYQPNKILVRGSRYTEIKVGDYLEAYYDETALNPNQMPKKLTRILSKKTWSGDPNLVEISCDAEIKISDFNNGLDAAKQTFRYTTIDDYVSTYKAISLKGFRVRQDSLPDGTEAKQQAILNLVAKGTPLFNAVTNKEAFDFRYLIDSFGLGLTERSKQQLVDICGERLDCFGILNMPSLRSFKNSSSPSFVNSEGVLQTEFIAKGGDPESNPAFLYTFGDGRGVSSVGYFTPYLTVNDNGRPIDVPPSAYVGLTFMRKHNSTVTTIVPWTIAAGVTNGRITNIAGLEGDFTPTDIENLNQAQMNPIVFKRNRGYIIETENTAQTLYRSALSYIHVREVLIELERELSRMLLDFQWKFNTPEIRAEIKLRADVICEKYVSKNGLYNYFNKCDEENNTSEIIDNQIGVLDTYVEPIKGMGIIVNNITILRTGAIQAGGFITS
jgi:hypothetical protein